MSETAQALGQRLKTEREKRGMSAQKMADDMHLDAWVIDALEAGEYERIGPPVYAQGHLRKYASILGVSAAQASAPQPKLAGPAPPTPIIRLDPPGGGGSIWPVVGGFAVVALVAGGIAWWRPWESSRTASAAGRAPLAAKIPGATGATSAGESAGQPDGGEAGVTANEGEAPNAGLDAGDINSGQANAGQISSGQANPGPDAVRAHAGQANAGQANAGSTMTGSSAGRGGLAAAAAVTPASTGELTPGVGRARLRLSFSADSRVAVYDYTGKSVFTGYGRANSVKTLAGMAPFRVFLGFASGVQLQVNDRAVAIGPQFVSGDVARFEAGADGVLRRDPRPMPSGGPAPAAPLPAAATPHG
jgi:cytoskeleton protein RodZ